MKKGLIHIFVASCLLLQTAPSAEPVVYPIHMQIEENNSYPLALLKHSLSYSDSKFELVANPNLMMQGRALLELENKQNIDVVWTMTSIEREKKLRPIRIPLYKGLFGVRIFWINQEDQARFSRVKNLRDLQFLRAGQGHDWPDFTILQDAGFTVMGGSDFHGLFAMLTRHRFDFFPRSIAEIWNEKANIDNEHIAIETELALVYPTAIYYFVNKDNERLAEAIETGLQQAIEDGSFDRLFYQFHAEFIQQSRLEQRLILQVPNSILPPLTPINEHKYWLRLDQPTGSDSATQPD